MDAKRVVRWGFELAPEIQAKLLELTFNGKRKCAIECFDIFEKSNAIFPQVGDLQLVLGIDSRPAGLVSVRRVRLIRFSEFTQDTLDLIGEPFELDLWKSFMLEMIRKQSEKYGFEYSEDEILVVTEFEIEEVYNK